MTSRLTVVDRIDESTVAQIEELMTAATITDGAPPLSEHVRLHLRHGGDDGDRSLLLHADDGDGERLVGYAHLDPTDEVDGSSGELVVHPQARRHGYGRLLVDALRSQSPDGRLRLWAHGTHSAAAALAASNGFDAVRVLWQMRRSLWAPLATPQLPAGITLRTFEPGRDEEAWLTLNAEVFADHQEQGRLERQDLDRRMAEPWFDPKGFLLAEHGDRLVGYHWTKVHGRTDGHGHEELGEVYVVGVCPDHRGTGLGRALLLAGLHHLRGRGLATAMLYVDEGNRSGIGLYESLGFSHWDTDAEYRVSG